ncbi:MAG: hypothetical protein ABF335_00185 [Alphaproteobacteria bacterium]
MFNRFMRWYINRTADKMEQQSKTDMTMMREIGKGSGGMIAKFGLFAPVSQHRKAVPLSPWFVARIASAQVIDCGPCTQIVVNFAVLSKVPTTTIEATLAGGAALTGDDLLAYRYGKAVAENDLALIDYVEQVRDRWGDEGLVEMALSVAASQVYPMAKRGLGLAVSCSQVRIAPELIDMTDGSYHPAHLQAAE